MKLLRIIAFALSCLFCFCLPREEFNNKSTFLKPQLGFIAEGEEKKSPKDFHKVVVGSYGELLNSINDETVTDIVIGRNLEIKDTILISSSVTIDGGGNSLSFSSENQDSNNPIFKINGAKEVHIENLTISGSGIISENGNTLEIINSQIINSYIPAINSSSKTTIIKDTAISNNLTKEPLIINKGQMILDSISITENMIIGSNDYHNSFVYSEKNTSLYINNTTIAKNVTQYNGSAVYTNGGKCYILNTNILGNVFLFGSEDNSSLSGAVCLKKGANGKLLNNIIVGNSYKNSSGVFIPCDVYADRKSKLNGKFNLISTENASLSKNDDNVFVMGTINDFALSSPSEFIKDKKDIKSDLISDFFLPNIVELPNKVAVPILKGGINLSGGCRTIFDYDNKDNIIVGYIIGDKYKLVSGKKEFEMKCVDTIAGGGKRVNGLIGNSYVDPLLSESLVVLSVSQDERGTVPQFALAKGEVFSKGDIVTITALPQKGFEFESWDIDLNKVEVISKDMSSQTISIKINESTTIKPNFKKSSSNENFVVLVSDKSSFATKVDKKDNSFILTKNSIMPQKNKVLCGFNTRPDGTGENYLLGKRYNTKNPLVLYAIWSQDGYGYLTGHTEADSIVSIYGRDDFYLGGSNAKENGDYIITNIIPSLRERTIIRSSSNEVLQSEIIDILPAFASDVTEKNEAQVQIDSFEFLGDVNSNAEEVLSLLKLYKQSQISYDWLPDIKKNIPEISKLKKLYEALNGEQLEKIDEGQKIEIEKYINAYNRILKMNG